MAAKRTAWLGALAVLLATSAAAYTPSGSSSGDATKDFETLLRDLDVRQKRLEKELEEIGPRLKIVEKRTRARGRAYYRLVRAGLLPVGGGFEALVDHAAAVERARGARLSRCTRDARARQRRRVGRVSHTGRSLS